MYVPQPQPNPQRKMILKRILTAAIIVGCIIAAVLLAAIAFVVISKQDDSPQLADQYTGTSHNVTAQQLGLNGRATIKLTFTSKNPQALSGNIVVTGRDLGGSGIFDGTLVDSRITLNVHPMDGVPAFKLVGTVAADGSMSGSLNVPGDAAVPAQTGTWTAQPVRQ